MSATLETVLEHITIKTNGFETDGLLACRGNQKLRGRILIQAPNPFLGGTIDHPVITTMLLAFAQAGFAALAWNYQSDPQGQSDFMEDHGIDSRSEYLTQMRIASRWFENLELGGSKVITGYAGYSFGALISILVADIQKPVFAISPPLSAIESSVNLNPATRIIIAEDDFAVKSEEVNSLLLCQDQSVKQVVISGADHFYLDHLESLETELLSWIKVLG